MAVTRPSRALCGALCLYFLLAVGVSALSYPAQQQHLEVPANVDKVNVDLFVMSQCPDAISCEEQLGPVLQRLKHSITITLHYIGRQKDDGTWYCMHGQQECEGNIQQLCVQQHTKPYLRYDWLFRFVACNNKAGREKIGLFTTAVSCLKEAGIPLSAATRMLGCMALPGRQELLEGDLAATAATGITTSCTLQVEGATACVRDGGEWVEPCPAGSSQEQLLAAICQAYAGKNRGREPPECKQLPTQ